MTRYLAGVLTVIAVGVLLIAYGLLIPRGAVADASMLARPTFASDRIVTLDDQPIAQGRYAPAAAYPVSNLRTIDDGYAAPRQRTVVTRPVSYQERPAPARVARSTGRDWQKTALIIGGSTAAAAGLGAIFGGKKGALIGAAIGGGASTIYEVKRR